MKLGDYYEGYYKGYMRYLAPGTAQGYDCLLYTSDAADE